MNSELANAKAIFLTNAHDFDSDRPGGVQICSQEYFKVLSMMHQNLISVNLEISRRVWDKVMRKTGFSPYRLYTETLPTQLKNQLISAAPEFVYVNKSEAIRVTAGLRKLLPNAKIFLLSHGNQSGDDLFELSSTEGRYKKGFKRLKELWKLGCNMTFESNFRRRQIIDGVITMSEEEVVLEQWLGASRAFYFPRIVEVQPIRAWLPVKDRIGFIGTLDHTPNKVALERLLTLGLADYADVRIIGGPSEAGQALQKAFPNLHYCGPLSEEAARTEIASWSLALNPVFWLSRGASMKLRQLVSFGIPTLSTKYGSRGYANSNELFFTSENSEDAFFDQVKRLLENDLLLKNQREHQFSHPYPSPTAAEIAFELSEFVAG